MKLGAEPVPKVELTGRWIVTIRIDKSDLERYRGIEYTFNILLRQKGERLSGIGEKWKTNGVVLKGFARAPISVEGEVDGKKVAVSYTEKGAKRTSVGQFILELTDDRTMVGTVSGTAANSSGTCSWVRQSTEP